MKNLIYIIVILTIIFLFGSMFVGCKEDEKPIQYGPEDIPGVLIMNDGTDITTAAQWADRRAEISKIMLDNSYGQWRSGETVTYEISENSFGKILTAKVSNNGINVSFNASVELPTGTPQAGGWPVIMAFSYLDGEDFMSKSKGNPHQYAADKGYAIINLPTAGDIDWDTFQTTDKNVVASDDNAHKGAFYTLYPYGSTPESQTGVLMAWAWGASKMLDALEAGAAEEFNINANNTIITGTSRNGKAAAVAGAFEERFKITVPASSGAGGTAIYRYKSAGQTYDLGGYFSYNNGGSWTVDGDNPQSLGSIQNDSGGGWFNAKFKTFSKPENLPFDQHYLLALCADTERYLFMVNGFEWDKWTNPPGAFYAFELTKPVFDLLGVPENIAVSMHRYRHGLEQEDMVKLIKYANNVFYGIKDLTFDYAETGKPKPSTWETFIDDLHKTPFSKPVSSRNNATYEKGKPRKAE